MKCLTRNLYDPELLPYLVVFYQKNIQYTCRVRDGVHTLYTILEIPGLTNIKFSLL